MQQIQLCSVYHKPNPVPCLEEECREHHGDVFCMVWGQSGGLQQVRGNIFVYMCVAVEASCRCGGLLMIYESLNSCHKYEDSRGEK